MMKKTYTSPFARFVRINTKTAILAASGEEYKVNDFKERSVISVGDDDEE